MCPKITRTLYKTRHNNVAAAIHHSICQHYEIKNDREHLAPQAQTSSGEQQGQHSVGLLRSGQTDRQVQTHRPHLVVIDKQTKEGLGNPNDTCIVDEGTEEDRNAPGPEVRDTGNVEHQSRGSTNSNRRSQSNHQQS